MGEALWPYERVLTELRRRIKAAEYDVKLPPRVSLAEEFSVSHMTIQRAVDQLKEEGLVFSVAGLGVFVAKMS